MNALISQIAGEERVIELAPDFEAVAGLRGHSNKPERAWNHFSTPGVEVPEPLARAVTAGARVSGRLAAHVGIPPAGSGLDLLDDVDPHAGGVDDAETPLAPRLVRQLEGELDARPRRAVRCSARASATWNVMKVPSPEYGPGDGGEEGWSVCMNASATGRSASLRSKTNQSASKPTSNPNQRQ